MASSIGLSSWKLALIDPMTNLVIPTEKGGLPTTDSKYNGVFIANLLTSRGATTANLSGMDGAIQKIYGSDAVADVSVGNPEPTVALAANSLPHEVQALVQGLTKISESGSYRKQAGSRLPYVALMTDSHDWDGNRIHFGFFMGVMALANANQATNNNQQQRATDSYTYTAIASDAGDPYEVLWEAENGYDYDKFAHHIFPQTAADVIQPSDQDEGSHPVANIKPDAGVGGTGNK